MLVGGTTGVAVAAIGVGIGCEPLSHPTSKNRAKSVTKAKGESRLLKRERSMLERTFLIRELQSNQGIAILPDSTARDEGEVEIRDQELGIRELRIGQ